MTWFFGVLLVLLVGGIAVVAAGQGESLSPAETDEPRPRLPTRPLVGDDLRAVRFSTALRGYRAVEVDALLARLAQELDQREGREARDAPEGTHGTTSTDDAADTVVGTPLEAPDEDGER